MANPTIQLDNSTASLIALVQLGIDVPASGSIIVTVNPNTILVNEVINDPELNVFVDAGDITLTVDAVALTAQQSKAYVGYNRVLNNENASLAPTVNDDADAGYSVNSAWIDTTNIVSYLCVDPTANGAVWVRTGGGQSSFGSPVSVGIANADGSSGLHTQSDHVHAHADQPGGSLHALVTTLVNGFMSAADKLKLDGLVQQTSGSEFTSLLSSTTLGTFQDAFPTQNIPITVTGVYMIQFEGNIAGSAGSTENEIGITRNGGGGPAVITDSQRLMQGNGGASISTYCHTFVNLTAGDIVTGVFRKASGPGTTTVGNRRITLIRFSVPA